MDGDVYFAEHIMRERLAEVRARARFAALRGGADQPSRRANGSGRRLLEFARSLGKRRGRRAAGMRRPLGGGTLDDLHGKTTVL